MLKRSYKYKYGKTVAKELLRSLHVPREAKQVSTFQLCFSLLDPVIDKITIDLLRNVKEEITIRLTPKAALALHVAYLQGYIDTDCIYVREIFTEIDRSI